MKKQYVSPNTKVINVALTGMIVVSGGIGSDDTTIQASKDEIEGLDDIHQDWA